LRGKIIPSLPEQVNEPSPDHAHAQGTPARLSCQLLKRVFDIVLECSANRGGTLKIIVAIEDAPVIVRILSHLYRPTQPRPATLPAQRFDLLQTV